MNALLNFPEYSPEGSFLSGFLEKKHADLPLMQITHFVFALQILLRRYEGKSLRTSDFLLLSGSLFALQILLSSRHYLLTFFSLEMITFAGIVFAAQPQNQTSADTSLKFFFNAALASAFFLFGVSVLFMLDNKLLYADTEQILSSFEGQIGFAFIVLGFAFKIGLFPFQAWLADFFESSELWVLYFVAFASKIVVLHNFGELLLVAPSGFKVVATFAVLSLIIGAILGVLQKELRRLIAYSSVVQSGFLTLCVLYSGGNRDVTIFYFTAYFAAGLGLILLLRETEKCLEGSRLDFLSSLPRNFTHGGAVLLSAFTLSGFPLTAGFWAKMYLFLSVWEAKSASEYVPYLLAAMIFSTAVSLYYYLKLPYYYFVRVKIGAETIQKSGFLGKLLLVVFFVLALLPFFFPSLFFVSK